MIRTILVSVLFAGLTTTGAVRAEASNRSNKKGRKQTIVISKGLKVVPAAPLKDGWMLVNGAWIHSDGYKLVNGEVIRTGIQTHKKAPKPPTKVEMRAAMKNARVETPADMAARKAAERERNLTPGLAPQTGMHF